MNTKLYVGGLSTSVTETDLLALFSKKGEVNSVEILRDRNTGAARGYAYITMKTPEAAKAALASLHSHLFAGRYITVHEARQESENRAGLIGSGSPLKRGL